jgi:16S rRNA processing protein RimM
VELWSNRPERHQVGAELSARLLDQERPLVVLASRPFGPGSREPLSRWLFRFEAVSDRTAAEALRGAVLLGRPIVDPDAFWVDELCGAPLVDPEGRPLGEVRAVLANPASDLLELADGRLLPLRFIVGRTDEGFVVEAPAGLLDDPPA